MQASGPWLADLERDPDLVLQEGWEGSFEFVRDPWVKGSFAMAFPEALPGPTLE